MRSCEKLVSGRVRARSVRAPTLHKIVCCTNVFFPSLHLPFHLRFHLGHFHSVLCVPCAFKLPVRIIYARHNSRAHTHSHFSEGIAHTLVHGPVDMHMHMHMYMHMRMCMCMCMDMDMDRGA